jgi:hypothetical protein
MTSVTNLRSTWRNVTTKKRRSNPLIKTTSPFHPFNESEFLNFFLSSKKKEEKEERKEKNKMEDSTTSIDDLPVDSNMPYDYDMPESAVHSVNHRNMDPEVYIPQAHKRHVTFQEEEDRDDHEYVPKKNNFDFISDQNKVILAATMLFILFGEVKVKGYILNILTVIFGQFIRNMNGGMSQVGLLLYGLVYGLTLWVIFTILDVSALKLAF